MKITGVSRQKRSKQIYSVFIDGAFAFSVTDENRVKYHLDEGRDITPAEIQDITAADEYRRAMDYSLTLLGVRGRSGKELIERLRQKEFSPAAAAAAVRRLEELGYMDDARFARQWYQSLKEKGNGPERIRMELRAKGVDAELIADLLREYNADMPAVIDQLKSIVERKLKTMKNVAPEAAARRLTGFLARKGFSIDVIRQVLREMLHKEEE